MVIVLILPHGPNDHREDAPTLVSNLLVIRDERTRTQTNTNLKVGEQQTRDRTRTNTNTRVCSSLLIIGIMYNE